jgi:WD40 repeat protein
VTLEGQARVVHANPGELALRDVSPKGDVLLVRKTSRFSIHGLVPGAKEEKNLSWFASSYALDLSPDGRTLLLADWASAAGVRPLFVSPTDGSPAVRLGDGAGGRISPDGKWVATVRESTGQIVLLPTGAGWARELPNGEVKLEWIFAWFPDGKRVLAMGRKGSGNLGTFAQGLEDGVPEKILEGHTGWLVSPDGRSLLAQAQGKGPFLLCPLDGTACRPLFSLDPEVDSPERFSPDGRALIVSSYPTGMTIVFTRIDLATGRRAPITTLTPAERTGVFAFSYTSITPDGRYYVYSLGRSLSDLYLAKGLR